MLPADRQPALETYPQSDRPQADDGRGYGRTVLRQLTARRRAGSFFDINNAGGPGPRPVSSSELFQRSLNGRCFLPIHVYKGRPPASRWRCSCGRGKTPRWRRGDACPAPCGSVPSVARWPRSRHPRSVATATTAGPEAMTWCERRHEIAYVFGLARQQGPARAGDRGPGRGGGAGSVGGETPRFRRHDEFRYAARTWAAERQVIARVEASDQGSDSRFIVTNLEGTPRWLYEDIYCARGQAENLIKAHKLHLASDRTSCSKATANQFRLLIHTAAYWLLHTLRGWRPRPPSGATPSSTHRARLDQDRGPRHRARHPDQGRPAVELSLPGQPLPPVRPRRQAATLIHGAACRTRTHPGQPPATCPASPRLRRHSPTRPHVAQPASRTTPMNNPG